MEHIVTTAPLQTIDLAPATTEAEILQNVKTILTTIKYTVPLDRGFGIDASIVDLPIPVAQGKLSNEIFQAIKRYEPRASLTDIQFSSDITGTLQVKVKVRI